MRAGLDKLRIIWLCVYEAYYVMIVRNLVLLSISNYITNNERNPMLINLAIFRHC